MNDKIARTIALIIGCIILYTVLYQLTDGAFKMILFIGLIAYGMYRWG